MQFANQPGQPTPAVSNGQGSVIAKRPDGWPRRADLSLLEPVETQAWQLLQAIEALGAHPMLTDAVNAVQVVRAQLADWIDVGKPGVCPVPQPAPPVNGEDLED